MAEALLLGNNLAVLIAAAELGEAGRDVLLLTDGRPAGGHFRGLQLPGGDFDIGMVLVERTGSVGVAPDLTGYRPHLRYDWTRFGALVDSWLDAQVPLVRTPTPEVFVEGCRWADHLLADRLDVVTAGGFPAPPRLARVDPRHPAGKATSPAYDTLTYADAAELAHGREIQRRLLEPFAEKLLGPAYGSLLARYHRAAWLPLYWPETLAAACAGRPTGLREYPFWATRSGFTGDLVRALERRLAELPTVRVHGAPVEFLTRVGGRWEVRTQDGEHFSSARPALGLGNERLQELLGLSRGGRADGASVVVVCCLVRASAIGAPLSCLSVVDPGFTTYRVTDQDGLAGLDPEWHRLVVEAGPAAAARLRAGEDVPAAMVAELRRLLDLPGGDPRTSPDTHVLKTSAPRTRWPSPPPTPSPRTRLPTRRWSRPAPRRS